MILVIEILANMIDILSKAPKIKNPFTTGEYQRVLKKKNSLINEYSNKSSFEV